MRRLVSKTEYFAAAAAAFALSVSALLLGGCSGNIGVRFSVDEISIKVGEKRDIFPYAVFEPSTAADKSFALSSSDGAIVEVDGTVVRGVGKGAATVTAADGAEIKVNVSYRAPQELYIAADGATVRTLDNIADADEITFTATLDGYADPDTEIVWETDGEKSGVGSEFTLVPTRYGEYDVCARADGLSVHTYVRLYRRCEAYAEHDGELVQHRDFSPVAFYAREVKDTRDAPSAVEWRVNGELCGTSHVFEFTPSADGEYKVELTVNGVPRAFSDGAACATVTASGGRAPSCAVEFDADGVYIIWRDGGGAAAVSVTDPDGKRTVYERTDVEHAYRFGGGRFDATGLIEPYAAEPKSYTVSVSADGRGDETSFRQYGAEAAEFIGRKLFIGNTFAADAARAADIVRDAYACGRRSVRVYLGRGLDGREAQAAILSAAEELGLSATVATDGRIATVEFAAYSNSPNGVAEQTSSAQMYAELPHIEYDAAKLRGDVFLAVERLPRSVEVDNTEKLLLAVSRGYKPVATGAARTAYARARNALLNIIGKDFDAYGKIHAIYDWLQFVTFRTDGGDGAPCNYIDGIFGAAVGGAVRSGMSEKGLCKTFALLCGMEGIACSVERGADGCYYNAVTIDGAQYKVDAFGEAGGNELGLADAHAELTSHRGLFADIGSDGMTPSSTYLRKSVEGGVYFDKYIDAAEYADSAQIAAAIRSEFSAQKLGAVSLYTPVGVSIFQNATLGAELALDRTITAAQAEAVRDEARGAAAEYVKARFGVEPSNIRSYVAQDKLFLIVSVPHAAQ